jgi:hypothetical protein
MFRTDVVTLAFALWGCAPTPATQTPETPPPVAAPTTSAEPPSAVAPSGEAPSADPPPANGSDTCGGKVCEPPAECIHVVGMRPESARQECWITCGDKPCPADMTCTMINDGPGKVCVKPDR